MGKLEHASLAVELAAILDDGPSPPVHQGALIITDQDKLDTIRTNLAHSKMNHVLNLDSIPRLLSSSTPQPCLSITPPNLRAAALPPTTATFNISHTAKRRLSHPLPSSDQYRLILVAREDLSTPPSPPPPVPMLPRLLPKNGTKMASISASPASIGSNDISPRRIAQTDAFGSVLRRIVYAICQVLLMASGNESENGNEPQKDGGICIYLDDDLAEPIAGSALRLIKGMGLLLSSTVYDMGNGSIHDDMRATFSLRKISISLRSTDIASDIAKLHHETMNAPKSVHEAVVDRYSVPQTQANDQDMDLIPSMDSAANFESTDVHVQNQGSDSADQQQQQQLETGSRKGEGREVYRAIYESIMQSSSNISLYQPLPPPSPVKRALIVEDNKINQRILERTLKVMGVTSVIVDNGLDCLRLLFGDRVVATRFPDLTFPDAHPINTALPDTGFDIIFMDIVIPILDGIATASEIRSFEKRAVGDHAASTPISTSDISSTVYSICPSFTSSTSSTFTSPGSTSTHSVNSASQPKDKLRIVAISSLGNADMIARTFHAGMDGFILKPWKKDDIQRACGISPPSPSPASSSSASRRSHPTPPDTPLMRRRSEVEGGLLEGMRRMPFGMMQGDARRRSNGEAESGEWNSVPSVAMSLGLPSLHHFGVSGPREGDGVGRGGNVAGHGGLAGAHLPAFPPPYNTR
ncbi:hypothetical protein HDU97_004516 [Phlyctochytrium planicorne]|nr:hypothetical protein HDU97_004516 [Phlyctochytrium planicorne]